MLADYYHRGAVAAAQVLAGFDEEWFRSRLTAIPVGISVASDAPPEGAALAELVVRITARLYPKLALVGEPSAIAHLAELARAINPGIELLSESPLGIAVGGGAPFVKTIHVGSDGWIGLVSDHERQPVGTTDNPFGPGVAACLGVAALFRAMFLPDRGSGEGTTRFSALSADDAQGLPDVAPPPWSLDGEGVLVGAGAVGQGALWALSRAPLSGRLHVVDMEVVELSNLQRYVLTERSDEGREKVDIASELTSSLELVAHPQDLASFLGQGGYRWDAMLLALDNARDRIGAQASLPRFIANAWTQPGDLGVTSHSRFGGDGACVACLYMPDGPRKNEDELVAETLGVPHLLQQIRTLLGTGQPIDRGLLEAVADAVGQPLDRMLPFERRTLRELYVEGFCGGAAIPIGEAGRLQSAAQDVHVPLAHQSALAGILLAAALVRRGACGGEALTHAIRVDVLRPPGTFLRQPLRARRDGRCICDDPDFVAAYQQKYANTDV